MNIVIVGAGKVGSSIGRKLSLEDHNVAIIDSDSALLSRLETAMDIHTFIGNGVDHNVLLNAGVDKADILIAATEHDEINMLCCLIAHKLGAKRTIARVRDPINSAQLDFLKDELGLSLAINPEYEAAEEIARLIRIPSALNVELFARGKVELVGVRISNSSPFCNLSLNEISKKYKLQFLICAIQRGDNCYIPNGDFIVEAGDRLHITASHKQMTKVISKVYPERLRKIRNVIVSGGGRISYYLAKMFEHSSMELKLVEPNIERAKALRDMLPFKSTDIVDSSDGEIDALVEEGLETADAYISLTGMDEKNIVNGLAALEAGVKNIIIKVNNEKLVDAVPGSALGAVISPKQITANKIIAFVRAMSCSPEESNVETVYELVGGRIEALEFIAKGMSPMYGMPLRELHRYMHKGVLIASIVRGREIIIPGGDSYILPGDYVIVVTKNRMFHDLDDILASPIPNGKNTRV